MINHQVPRRPTQAHIDLDALAYNFHSSKSYIGSDVKVMAVVKADGYGHGARACALRLEAEGVDWLGVAIPEEGVELREAGVKTPILCLGSFWPGQEGLLVEYDLTPVIFNLDTAAVLQRHVEATGSTIDVHIKVDTGMGRVGIPFDSCREFADAMGTFGSLKINGLMTHFASADDPKQSEYTERQMARFREACDVFRAAGHAPEWIDMANSPGAIVYPGSRSNLVRLGGALYGLLDDILPAGVERPALKPVLSLKSGIADLREVAAGESLGYGRTFTTERQSTIALVPIGYADGYPRGLSNYGSAWVAGRQVPVVGRISMDWTLLDVTGLDNVSRGSEVYLIGGGPVGDPPVKASDLARITGTIAYEITCGISPRIPRIYVEGERVTAV